MEPILYFAAGGAASLTVTFMIYVIKGRYYYWASQEVILDVSRLYAAMQRVINNTGADRFLIIELHNGGWPWDNGKRYMTIREEFHSPNVPSIRQDYIKFEVGPQYRIMVNNLEARGVMSGKTEDLEYGFLRDAYEKDGIKSYHLFYIRGKGRRHFFGSISTVSENSLLTPQQYQEIRVCVQKVVQIMNNRKIY